MNKLDQKLIEYFELRELKNKYTRSQQYENAAKTREKERTYQRECYNIITNSDDDGYEWGKYNDVINEYCDERFGDVDYKTMIRVIIREEKLKQLGI
jgi:hypothetical protein